MKKYSIYGFVFFLFLGKTLLSQEIGSLSINTGYGFPIGKFAKMEIDPNNLGFAESTIFNEFQIRVNCNSRINLIGTYSFQIYSTDATPISDNLIAKLNIPPGNSGINASYKWGLKELSIGGGYKFLKGKKINIVGNLLLGYLIASSPDVLHLVHGGGWVYQESIKSKSLSTRLGLSCTYKPSKYPLFVSLNLDFIYAHANLKSIPVNNSNGTTSYYSINQPLNRLLLTLGIGFLINRVN